MELGLDYEILLDFYYKEIRTLLEYGSVVFHGALTKKQSEALESVQVHVLKLLARYLNLKMSSSELYILFVTEPLQMRRIDACKHFIKRTLKNPIHRNMFSQYNNKYETRSNVYRFKEHKAHTARFQNSPLVFLTKLANQMNIERSSN